MLTPRLEQVQALSPEFLAEDASKPLLHTCIAIIIVSTLIFMLFCASRKVHNNKDT